VAFLVGLGSFTTLLFALAPALRASRAAPMGVAGAGQSRATAHAAILQPLVAVQMAVSVTVLFLAGLLLVSFGKLLRVDLGFDKASVLLVEVQSDEQPGPGQQDPPATHAITMQLLDRVRALPGVQSASLSTWPMFTQGGWINGVRIPGRPPNDGDPVVHLGVSPGFVATMRMRLLGGRDFTGHDRATPTGSPVIVNEAFARRYFAGERVIGQRYERPGNNRIVAQEIVGVVADAKYNDLREPAPPTVFVPLTGFGTLQVRTAGDPLALGTLVRREVLATHPSLWVSGLTLQSALIDNALIRERLLAVLSGFFGGIGLLLAIVGLYGVLSYAVVRRTREIGIRMSLGAPRVAVVRAVLTKIGAMTMVGSAIGLGGGLFLARFIRAWLFEVTPLNVSSLALPVAALLAAAAAAAIVPALRATRVDPVVALRAE
jgi:predicted permease